MFSVAICHYRNQSPEALLSGKKAPVGPGPRLAWQAPDRFSREPPATLTLRAEVAPLAGSFCSLHPADRMCELTVVKAVRSLCFWS
ncbi:hypothetical protein ABIF21_002438 [Bradyrhizobium elkanii]|jgi:hypothetical protein|nr:hypothetical protein [Bradyrhizobium elkanii]MCW2203667.1 hypothetical protein [Bradyrhizobium elkanii]MCW2233939.1 hypothetical protein [Bradyrhizobium elkanii]